MVADPVLLIERFYASHAQATVVQVSPAELHAQLDRELAARGYRRQAPTVVLTAPLDRLPTGPPPTPALAVSVAETPEQRWLAAWSAIEGRPDATATTILQAGAHWAADQAAHHLYLQVEDHHLPALRLYHRLGFTPSHHYHYRVAARR
jgi:N-acetylglutamate synthase